MIVQFEHTPTAAGKYSSWLDGETWTIRVETAGRDWLQIVGFNVVILISNATAIGTI
ncbi:MAG: hypothetical protein ACOX6Y_03825 [Christensenellales bacterium]